jgi:outer membrane lipopolysaccharide assembly protein LptE/RlpB
MIKKNSIILIILFFLSNCGYTPMYSNNKKVNFYIEEINFNKGDIYLINQLKSNLKNYLKEKEGNKFIIDADIQYNKKIVSRNNTGDISEYNLSSTAIFLIKFKDTSEKISISESFNMENLEDEFSEIQYEEAIKQNMAQSTITKLISKLLRLNDN